MSEKIYCPTCGHLLSETLTAAEIKEIHNPCDTLTRQQQVELIEGKRLRSEYIPTLIPGCPKDIERKNSE